MIHHVVLRNYNCKPQLLNLMQRIFNCRIQHSFTELNIIQLLLNFSIVNSQLQRGIQSILGDEIQQRFKQKVIQVELNSGILVSLLNQAIQNMKKTEENKILEKNSRRRRTYRHPKRLVASARGRHVRAIAIAMAIALSFKP